MHEATIKSTRSFDGRKEGQMLGGDGRWTFVYDEQQIPLMSSRRKRVYVGTFEREGERPVRARALVYFPEEFVAFGRECANLRLMSSLGVGPRLLAIDRGRPVGSAVEMPVLIEQDAGECLATLIDGRSSAYDVRFGGMSPAASEAEQELERVRMAAVGTPERALQNAKIMYDVMVQLQSAHKSGIYHRDLRCENVCVRRFGPAPQDIRATVIDFDLGASAWEGKPHARAPLYHTLFEEIPLFLGYGREPFDPNPLELDMAYLAALQYHLERNRLSLNGRAHADSEIVSFLEFIKAQVGYFDYRAGSFPPHARELDMGLDIKTLAERLGLVRVDEKTFASAQLLVRAKALHRPFFDEEDLQMCNQSPEAALAAMVDKIAHAVFEDYNALRRSQGKPVEYDRMEDQPQDLQRSNYAQAEDIPVKVRALGYELVPIEECDPECVVDALTDEQVEVLARLEHDRFVEERIAAGWTLDRSAAKSNPERKTSPFLVPYDELAYDVQEYDRDAVRQMIPLLRMAGLAMARRR
jgi:hypothetical protein